MINALDHVTIAMPEGGKAEAVQFFSGLLGLKEIAKPDDMKTRGGCWFALGHQQLHISADPDFAPAKKAHIAVTADNLNTIRQLLESAGHAICNQGLIGERRRFFSVDPFGNRLEFIETQQDTKA